MATILIAYATAEGQTRKIVEFIGGLVEEAGNEVVITDIDSIQPDWFRAQPDAVLIAASVHVGRHPEPLGRFITEHRGRLEAIASAFLSVSLSAAGDAAAKAEANNYVSAFLQETGWRPTLSATSGGALRYSQYGFFKRLLMKQIARRGGLPTDTSDDYEFTDWEEIRRFTAEFLQCVDNSLQAGAVKGGSAP